MMGKEQVYKREGKRKGGNRKKKIERTNRHMDRQLCLFLAVCLVPQLPKGPEGKNGE